MKFQLSKSDFLLLCQSFVSEQFDNTMVTGITFVDSSGTAHAITKVELDYKKISEE